MNDLVEQYNLELRYQEKKSNVRTLRSFLWFFIAMVVTWGLNDRYGHAEGDALIDKMSGILHEFMHGGCRVYRVGGDEFVMIMDNAGDEQAKDMVAAVRRRMSEVRTDNAFRISSAVGYSSGKGRDVGEIVKQADENMYIDKARCKQSGDEISRRG